MMKRSTPVIAEHYRLREVRSILTNETRYRVVDMLPNRRFALKVECPVELAILSIDGGKTDGPLFAMQMPPNARSIEVLGVTDSYAAGSYHIARQTFPVVWRRIMESYLYRNRPSLHRRDEHSFAAIYIPCWCSDEQEAQATAVVSDVSLGDKILVLGKTLLRRRDPEADRESKATLWCGDPNTIRSLVPYQLEQHVVLNESNWFVRTFRSSRGWMLHQAISAQLSSRGPMIFGTGAHFGKPANFCAVPL